jgi:hypothetical protein
VKNGKNEAFQTEFFDFKSSTHFGSFLRGSSPRFPSPNPWAHILGTFSRRLIHHGMDE